MPTATGAQPNAAATVRGHQTTARAEQLPRRGCLSARSHETALIPGSKLAIAWFTAADQIVALRLM